MQTITFSEQPLGTVDPVYLCKINVVWIEGEIVADTGSRAVAPSSAFNGSVTVHFNSLVSNVTFDARGFDSIGSTIVSFFDGRGRLLASFQNDAEGLDHFAYSNAAGIAKMVVRSMTDEFTIDSLSFATISPKVFASGDQDIDGLLWGYRWDHKVLTFSFPTSGAEYLQNGYRSVQGFEAMSPQQVAAYMKILDNFGAVCGLSFVQSHQPAADIRFGKAMGVNYSDGYGLHMPGNGTAEGTPPDPDFATSAWGDAWFTYGNYESVRMGTYAYAAGLMHELGHTLGLKHGHAAQIGHGYLFPTLPADHDSYEYSVMTYSQYVGDTNGFDNAPDHPTTIMQDDIAALQHMYGADYGPTSNNTRTIYRWDPVTGQQFINGEGHGKPLHGKVLLTVWDGGGHDTYNFANYATNLTIDLRPGAWTLLGGQIANLGDGHFARGNIANARQYHFNAASLIEDAIGGSGADTVIGNQKGNMLAGGPGADALHGLGGGDILRGGGGRDSIFSGAGKDTIVFDTRLTGAFDTIFSFSAPQDTMRLDKTFFPGLAGLGTLRPANFHVGPAAVSGLAQIVYDPATGGLYFDANGSDPGAIQFALLVPGLGLTRFDFVLVA